MCQSIDEDIEQRTDALIEQAFCIESVEHRRLVERCIQYVLATQTTEMNGEDYFTEGCVLAEEIEAATEE